LLQTNLRQGIRSKKLLAVWGWLVEWSEYCSDCKANQKQTGKKENCQTCEALCPKLIQENKEAWQLWTATRTQWRTSFGGIVGLDYTALLNVAGIYAINVNPGMMRKIKALENYELERCAKEGKKNGGK